MVVSESKSPAKISGIKEGDTHKMGDDLSCGKDLNLGIVNQYGQLMGEYSKLDDELWLSEPHGVDNGGDDNNDEIQCQIVPFHENLDDQGQQSDHIDNSVSKGVIISVNETSSNLKHILQNPSQISSPVSVLQNRQGGRVQSLGPTREQSQGFDSDQSEYSIGSSLLNDSEESITDKHQVRTRKISDLLDLNLEPPKKCLHCETSETPQWRTGPMGRKTLCNACGVQYKHGRLFADYRPLKSPTFDPSLHSNFPKKVQETRMGKTKTSEISSIPTPKPKKFKGTTPMMDTSLHPDLGIGVREVIVRYTSERYPHITTNPEKVEEKTLVVEDTSLRSILEKKVQDMIMGNTSKRDQNINSDPKKVEETRSVCYNEVQSRAERAKKFQEMREKVSDIIPLLVDSSEMNQKSSPKEIVKQKKPLKATQKCLHCETTKTPQWREGPMGRNTLCNACGVQYRHGRLFPEYCPLKSPKYDPSLHSHMPKKVLEMRMRNSEKKASSTTNYEEAVGVSSMK